MFAKAYSNIYKILRTFNDTEIEPLKFEGFYILTVCNSTRLEIIGNYILTAKTNKNIYPYKYCFD